MHIHLCKSRTHTHRYYLQIDSHMRFAHGWDDFLISELKACPSDKPVISTYPPGYKGQGKKFFFCEAHVDLGWAREGVEFLYLFCMSQVQIIYFMPAYVRTKVRMHGTYMVMEIAKGHAMHIADGTKCIFMYLSMRT
jgi:hypothetical protein